MKQLILAILAVLIIAGAGYWYFTGSSVGGFSQYNDPNGAFSLQVPSSFTTNGPTAIAYRTGAVETVFKQNSPIPVAIFVKVYTGDSAISYEQKQLQINQSASPQAVTIDGVQGEEEIDPPHKDGTATVLGIYLAYVQYDDKFYEIEFTPDSNQDAVWSKITQSFKFE